MVSEMLEQRPELFLQGETVYVNWLFIFVFITSFNLLLITWLISYSFIIFLNFTFSRPGIIVLVNDQDYQLCGGDSTELVDGDQVTFISTLHGG